MWKLYCSSLCQVQESGRYQAHSLLDIALLGALCQIAWSQGDDLYGYDHNRALLGAEYVAKYNLLHDVPYTSYTNSDVTQPVISEKFRGAMRPIWALLYNNYVVLKGITSPYVEAFAKKASPEGCSGDYGPNSGSSAKAHWSIR